VDVVIAVGGAYGTLSEVALALKTNTPVIGLGTWEIAGIEQAHAPAAAARRALELAPT
jgi:predicted polyphosphate/ATP-dependent NAD kinase